MYDFRSERERFKGNHDRLEYFTQVALYGPNFVGYLMPHPYL